MTQQSLPQDSNPSENLESTTSETKSQPVPTSSEISDALQYLASASSNLTNLTASLEALQPLLLNASTGSVSAISDATVKQTVDLAASSSGQSHGLRQEELKENEGQSGSFFNQLKGIPLDYLISVPLVSAARSNMALAGVMLEFIDMIGFDDGGNTRLIKFELNRPCENPVTKQWEKQKIEVNAPLLGLVPIPALLVDSVNINLNVSINNVLESTSNTTTENALNVGVNWGWFNTTFTGKVTTESGHKRHTDQSATYDVNVSARQQELPEGMSKLMDVMASVITPLPSGQSS